MITRTNLNNVQETGRLGNQMWAIASAIGIAKKNNTHIYFPYWEYQRWFSNKLPYDADVLYYAISRKLKIYQEDSPYYQDIKLDENYFWDLKGYFQSYKYFDDYKNVIRHYFTHNFEMNDYSKELVAVHVRRGDYINLQSVHPLLTEDYYRTAMEIFPRSNFLIFSDDIDWVSNCGWFDSLHCIYKVDESPEMTNVPHDLLHMMYMAQCKSFIIANSSFSWWAAYLSDSPDKVVVAPKTWVLNEDRDDRIPPEWIRL